jgi:hypothetical protein
MAGPAFLHACQAGTMLPKIKDFSSLLMANDPAGERPVFGSVESELRRVKRIEHRDNGQAPPAD